MATTNPTITADWTLLVADSGRDFFLSLPFASPHDIEVATTENALVPPSGLSGHVLSGNAQESINRALLGPGAVFARCARGTLSLVLNTWTSAVLLFTAGTWDTSATWLTDSTWG